MYIMPMSGLRKNIYIKDEEIWDSVKVSAKNQGRSVSNYLIWLHRAFGLMKTDGQGNTELFIPDSHGKGYMQDEIEEIHGAGKTIIESFDSESGKLKKPDPVQKAQDS